MMAFSRSKGKVLTKDAGQGLSDIHGGVIWFSLMVGRELKLLAMRDVAVRQPSDSRSFRRCPEKRGFCPGIQRLRREAAGSMLPPTITVLQLYSQTIAQSNRSPSASAAFDLRFNGFSRPV